MAYKFRLTQVLKRKHDGVIVGLRITVECENLDNGATSSLTWFALKTEFSPWPPSFADFKAYCKAYLKEKPAGSNYTRLQIMKQEAVLIEDEPEDSLTGELEE